MSNPRFSLNDCSAIQRQVRVTADVQDGLTVDRAYDIAERTLEKLFHEKHPSPAPPKPKEENVLPRVPCTQHREKVHIFSDRTVWKCCSHHECGWGRTTQKHSDGMVGETLYAFDVPDAVENDEVESSPDDPTELSMDTMPMLALVDEGEVGIVPELTWEDEVLEEANSEKADDGVMLECE